MTRQGGSYNIHQSIDSTKRLILRNCLQPDYEHWRENEHGLAFWNQLAFNYIILHNTYLLYYLFYAQSPLFIIFDNVFIFTHSCFEMCVI